MRSITSSDQFRVRDAQGKQATLFVSPVTEYDDWVFWHVGTGIQRIGPFHASDFNRRADSVILACCC